MATDGRSHDFVGFRWNYAGIAILTGPLAVGCAAVSYYEPWNRGSLLMHLIFLSCMVLMSFTSIRAVARIIYPTMISLSPSGIDLTVVKTKTHIPWSAYDGMRGGPNLLLRVRTPTKNIRQYEIGVWPINIETRIYEYANNLGIKTPLRFSAYQQVSAGTLYILAAAFLLIAATVAAFGILQAN